MVVGVFQTCRAADAFTVVPLSLRCNYVQLVGLNYSARSNCSKNVAQHLVWHHYADWVSISLKTAAAVTSPPEGAAGWKNCRTADRFCFDWSWFQPSATPRVLRFLSFKFDFKMRLLECVLALCSLLRWFFKKKQERVRCRREVSERKMQNRRQHEDKKGGERDRWREWKGRKRKTSVRETKRRRQIWKQREDGEGENKSEED